jgi:hypothetical protein
MTRDRPKPLRQDLTQGETDHQRWADDGGRTPEPQPDPPLPLSPVALPVRLVYRRSAGWGQLFLPLAATHSVPAL